MKQYTINFHAEVQVWAENEYTAVTKGFNVVLNSGNAFLYPTEITETPPIHPQRLDIKDPEEEEA